MKAPRVKWRVWTGTAFHETFAVSEKQAVSNVIYRMRKMGKFPLVSQFRAEEVK